MWRSFLAMAAVYAVGHPNLDGYRPASIDRPLQAFYREVNLAARDGQRVLVLLDDARAMRYMKGYIEAVDTQLRAN